MENTRSPKKLNRLRSLQVHGRRDIGKYYRAGNGKTESVYLKLAIKQVRGKAESILRRWMDGISAAAGFNRRKTFVVLKPSPPAFGSLNAGGRHRLLVKTIRWFYVSRKHTSVLNRVFRKERSKGDQSPIRDQLNKYIGGTAEKPIGRFFQLESCEVFR